MRLLALAVLLFCAHPAYAGGAYLRQDITGRWHYPELYPIQTSGDDVATGDAAGAEVAAPDAAAKRTPKASPATPPPQRAHQP